MVTRELKELVLTRLREQPVCVPNSMRTQWTIRCPYCGDSANQAHGHLSIKIDLDDDSSPMLYRCFKCDASGVVSDQFLQDIGIYLDTNSIKELRNMNRRSSKKNLFTNDRIENFVTPLPENTELNQTKLKYINDRLGLQLTYEDCVRLKIILDFDQFLRLNMIRDSDLTLPAWNHKVIQYWYVGFLCQSNNVINFRYIGKDPKYNRYLKVILNPHNHNPASFYMIPASITVVTDQPLNVYIAEGTFDIISIHENFGKDDDRSIYAAICGYGPGAILRYLIYNGLMYRANVHLYCDNDKSDRDEYNVILKHPEVLPWIKNLYFHRNMYENAKDYGIPKDHIQDEVMLAGRDGKLMK